MTLLRRRENASVFGQERAPENTDWEPVERDIRRFAMNFEWIAMEHSRLHMIEEWPEGPRKEASLAAIHSTLGGLTGGHSQRAQPFCEICLSRPIGPALVKFADQ